MGCPLRKKDKFNFHWSVHRKYIPVYMQQDATLHSLFISGNMQSNFKIQINFVNLHLVEYIYWNIIKRYFAELFHGHQYLCIKSTFTAVTCYQ